MIVNFYDVERKNIILDTINIRITLTLKKEGMSRSDSISGAKTYENFIKKNFNNFG